MDVSSALPDCNAHLSLVHDENCASLLLVDYAVFNSSAAYVLKQSDITHLVARDFYAGCHSLPPVLSCISVSSMTLRISESPVSLILNAEIMNSLPQTSA